VVLLPRQPRHLDSQAGKPLLVYCAAGIQAPVDAVARAYEKRYGVKVQLQYGGSGNLLANLKVARTGDLFIPADQTYVALGRQQGLLAEVIPLATQHPVIAVRRGNPKQIRDLKDLVRNGVKVSLANPEAASIGSITKKILSASGDWETLERQTRQTGVFKPTVNEVANDVKLGAVDAGIVWDATAQQYPDLEIVPVPAFEKEKQLISIAVLNSAQNPAAALRFARFLGARDQGQLEFARFHYQTGDGDAWSEAPELNLFSGSMLRPGIEQTLKDFEQREGVRINTVYNGCGILTAQMRAGQRPDAYFSCDVTFMSTVADLYHDSVVIAENEILIIAQKGNPLGIKTVQDLTKPGVRLGLAHPEKSAMGALTKNMLVAMGIYDAVCKNLKLDSPTGDFLVNQLRTGSLDAIIACRSNAKNVQEHVTVIPIDHPLAKAVQPYAVGKESKHRYLMTRLLEAIESPQSSNRFINAGFDWRYQPTATNSGATAHR
jgi:molybdenum ABC transporter molybdate-binding protein